jgi:tRNA(Ile)-lysidine synthase TilS/MesJ
MRRCAKCVLPETFPGISYDDEGICNFCRNFRGQEQLDRSINKYRKRFEKLLDEHRREGGYDCLMAFSGGKDSTYTLAVIKETYDLSILALTIDIGFIPQKSLDNIRNIVESLGIDHIIYKPRFDILRKLFSEATKSQMYARKTIERASTICTSCMGIIKFIALRMAVESNIPFIIYGWSPGQAPISASIFRNNPSMIRSMQKALFDPMYEATGSGLENYFLTEEHFTMEERFPYNISPLAFLPYDEDRIYETIGKLGWEKPTDTDPNSTNCLLNAFANKIHMDSLGYNPYAFELAKLVREKRMDRDEAIERLEKEQNEDMIAYVKRRLEID